MPHYFALKLSRHLNRYKYGKAKELGEAFGITRPKHWQQKRDKRFWDTALPVYYWVDERRGEGMLTRDDNKPSGYKDYEENDYESNSAFIEAANYFGISPALAEEYYYATKNGQIPKS